MTEPRIQYAKTSDGVSIAYWTLGEGPPLIFILPTPFSHIQREWEWPLLRRGYETLALKRRLVRYDGRGSGLSSRYVTDFSQDSLLLDLEAVIDELGAERVSLLAATDGGPIAISYAAQHPEKVTHLILYAAYARGGFADETEIEALTAMMDKDWRLFTETMARTIFSWSSNEVAGEWAQFYARCTTPELAKAAWTATFDFDVTELLPRVTARTLVLHPSQVRWVSMDQSTLLASQIPNARLAVLEGISGVMWFVEPGFVMASIDEFLGEGEEGVSSFPQPAAGAFRTILFTDIEGSTALTERLGDARAQELRRAHDTIVREALKGCGGSETKHTGDGIMASFPSASRAIECAVAVQRAIAERGDATLRVRIGLNAGEPVAEEADLFGTAVNLARRICDRAEPGQILVSDVVHQLAAGKGFTFADNGEAALKGFEKPVRLHEVRWRDD